MEAIELPLVRSYLRTCCQEHDAGRCCRGSIDLETSHWLDECEESPALVSVVGHYTSRTAHREFATKTICLLYIDTIPQVGPRVRRALRLR